MELYPSASSPCYEPSSPLYPSPSSSVYETASSSPSSSFYEPSSPPYHMAKPIVLPPLKQSELEPEPMLSLPLKKRKLQQACFAPPTKRFKMLHRFRPFEDRRGIHKLGEEGARPWLKPMITLQGSALHSYDPRPLFLLWDAESQNLTQSDAGITFLAGNPEISLVSKESRQAALRTHMAPAGKPYSPFLSLTSDLSAITDTWAWRFAAQSLSRAASTDSKQNPSNPEPDLYLTMVNPRTRVFAGLPLMPFREELTAYGIKHPIFSEQPGYSYTLGKEMKKPFADEWIVPYSITPSEIVGTWKLADLLTWTANTELNASQDLHDRVPLWFRHRLAKSRGAVCDDSMLPTPVGLEVWMEKRGRTMLEKHERERRERREAEKSERAGNERDRALFEW